MEGSDETIHKTKEVPKTYLEYLTKFSNFPTCWIIFPVSREQKVLKKLQKLARGSSHSLQLTRNIEVQRMYLTFKDAWVPNGTTIQVNDLVTGKIFRIYCLFVKNKSTFRFYRLVGTR